MPETHSPGGSAGRGRGPTSPNHLCPAPLRSLVGMAPADVQDPLRYDGLSLLCVSGPGAVGMDSRTAHLGRRSREGAPAWGSTCTCMYTHVPVCVGNIHTWPLLPLLPSFFPAPQLLQLRIRALAPAVLHAASPPPAPGHLRPPSFGVLQPRPCSVSAGHLPPSPTPPRPALSGGQGGTVSLTWRPLRLGPPPHTPPSRSHSS